MALHQAVRQRQPYIVQILRRIVRPHDRTSQLGYVMNSTFVQTFHILINKTQHFRENDTRHDAKNIYDCGRHLSNVL